MSWKITVMHLWKVTGALRNPNDIFWLIRHTGFPRLEPLSDLSHIESQLFSKDYFWCIWLVVNENRRVFWIRHKVLSTPRILKPKKTPQKKKENVVGESSELRKPLRIILTTKREENVVSVEKAVIAKEVDKMVDEKEEEEEIFVYSLLSNQKDPDTRLEHESYKESPKEKNDDDDDDDGDDDDHTDDALIRRK
nr:hypothetical protein [Tanacetum cinerariifolium]